MMMMMMIGKGMGNPWTSAAPSPYIELIIDMFRC
jgi:hypothetical protein